MPTYDGLIFRLN